MNRCRRHLAVVSVAVVALALPATSTAAAPVERFTISFPTDPTPVDDTCAGTGVEGVLTGDNVFSGQSVETSTTAHFTGTLTTNYRVDFPDGSYLKASQREHIVDNGQPGTGQHTFGSNLHEKGTLYNAQGAVTGHEMFHFSSRVTIRVDGTVAVDDERATLTCR